MADSYDVIVIGGGPGGYVAAIRAAQLGKKTAVVEKDKAGGRCLNYACIPAKTMLYTAEVYDHAVNGAELGIKVTKATLDWKALGERRAKVSEGLSSGVKMLWDKNKITMIEGEGSLTADGDVSVGGETYEAGAVILATGSVALPIPGVEFSERVLDTWGAWSLPAQPKRLAVVGAGASGSEIASAYARYGTEVILVEMLDQILPLEDKDCARVVERTFKKQGINVATGTKIEGVSESAKSVKLKVGDSEEEVDYLVIAGGRAPDTEPLGLAEAKVETEENGRIKVDDRPAHVEPEGLRDRRPGPRPRARAQGLRGGRGRRRDDRRRTYPPVDIDLIPGATFCHPQVASVGITEAEAKEAGREVKVAKFKLGGVGASAVYDDREGMVKLIADPKYGEIIGAHIVGNRACDMISEVVNVMALEGGYQELARIVHPHPTISEAILDAARAVDGWATHA